MVLDTSAVVAIAQHEDGFELLLEKLASAMTRSISAVSYMESPMVLIARRGEDAKRRLDAYLAQALISVVPTTAAQAQIARAAFRGYGKGRDRARLNFGDCFSYALAKYLDEELLFIGNDFSRTDIKLA